MNCPRWNTRQSANVPQAPGFSNGCARSWFFTVFGSQRSVVRWRQPRSTHLEQAGINFPVLASFPGGTGRTRPVSSATVWKRVTLAVAASALLSPGSNWKSRNPLCVLRDDVSTLTLKTRPACADPGPKTPNCNNATATAQTSWRLSKVVSPLESR